MNFHTRFIELLQQNVLKRIRRHIRIYYLVEIILIEDMQMTVIMADTERERTKRQGRNRNKKKGQLPREKV